MNSIFNLNRFSLLLRRRFALKGRAHLIALLVIMGISIFGLGGGLWMYWLEGSMTPELAPQIFSEIRDGLFKGIILISGSIFASEVFSDLGENGTGINYLMNPATHFEKWLVAFLMSTVLFLVVAFAIFHLAQMGNVLFFNALHPVKIPFSETSGLFRSAFWMPLMGDFLFIHALFFLGSIWFKAGHWWSTAAVCMVGIAFFAALKFGLAELVWPTGVRPQDREFAWFAESETDGFFRLPVSAAWKQTMTALTMIFPPLCWGLAYLRLTEKQI